jgi:prepilin signal peptidase PulO-like enzyme (type II secretory pathway)
MSASHHAACVSLPISHDVKQLGLAPVLLIASLSGLVAALVLAWKDGRGVSGQSAVAFGPWIALGGFAVWLMPQVGAPLP